MKLGCVWFEMMALVSVGCGLTILCDDLVGFLFFLCVGGLVLCVGVCSWPFCLL